MDKIMQKLRRSHTTLIAQVLLGRLLSCTPGQSPPYSLPEGMLYSGDGIAMHSLPFDEENEYEIHFCHYESRRTNRRITMFTKRPTRLDKLQHACSHGTMIADSVKWLFKLDSRTRFRSNRFSPAISLQLLTSSIGCLCSYHLTCLVNKSNKADNRT